MKNHAKRLRVCCLVLLSSLALSTLASAQLAGTYSVGVGGSYPDMSAAIAALNTQGVLGPVTFNVTGNQTGPWTISSFTGQGPSNPVIFEGGGTVALSGTNPILTMSGCSYVTMSGFTASFPSGEGFVITGSTSLSGFIGCNFTTPPTTSGATNRIFTFSGGTGCYVQDSEFGGGYEAFNLTGGNTLTMERCRILSGGFWIAQIAAPDFTFKNNFVYGNANYGFRAGVGSNNLRVYNNSFSITHAGSVGQGCSLRWYTSEYSEVINNAFQNINSAGAGHIMWCSGSFRPTVMDNNCYNLQNGISLMSSGGNQTLATWQALGFDLASIEADPLYVNIAATPPDLHLSTASPCSQAGQTLASVLDDIDGAPRVPNYDIGAHEATAANFFSAVTSGNGDLTMSLTMISSGATRGFTLLSFNTALPVGAGPFFGIYPDANTWSVFTMPQFPGNPFHFPVGPPSVYPDIPLYVLPGTLANLIGQSCDAMSVLLDGSNLLLGRSNIVRINW
jgi:hypothetical protein